MRKLILRSRSLLNLFLALVCVLLTSSIVLTGCSSAPAYVSPPASPSPSAPTPAPTPAPLPPSYTPPTPPVSGPATTPTNPQLESRARELEASVRQLQTENQRLLTENTQLRSELAKVTNALQNLYSLTTSSTYASTLNNLSLLQSNANQLIPWVHGLPHLPPLPPGLTVSQINDAVNKARNFRQLLASLPSLPPSGWPPFLPFPQELIQLDKGRQTFVSLTTWMENLQNLPTFLVAAGSLEDLRSRIEGYLGDVQDSTSGAKGLLEQVRNATVSPPTPTPASVTVQSPTTASASPQLEARIRELEASVRQLQAENQRLLAENTQLHSDLAKVTSMLQSLYSLATSSAYTNTLNSLSLVQSNTSQLVPWVHGLPHLPPLPPGLTVSQINDAVNKARVLRGILKVLPPPPPLAPSWWVELDYGKQAFIEMTTWMENLQDLPTFLAAAGSLEDLRSRVEGYMGDVQNSTSGAKGLLEQVRGATSTR